jgi:hypothetical protein
MVSNAHYFARRAAQEENRARQAVTPAAADRHARLAHVFRQKLDALGPGPLSLG